MDAEDLDACRRVNSAICRSFESRGLKAHYGSIAHLSLEEAGFEIDENRSYLHLCSGSENVAKAMARSVQDLQEVYVQTGLCSPDDVEKYIRACNDSASLGVYYATIAVTALKKKTTDHNKAFLVAESSEVFLEDGFHFVQDENEIMQCFSLMQQLRSHLREESFISQIREQITEGYNLVCLRKNGKLTALAGFRISTNLAWGKHLYIDDFVSCQDERSKGYGREMIRYLLEFARSKACKQLHLDSGVQRFHAHKFYLRENMKISSHHFSIEC